MCMWYNRYGRFIVKTLVVAQHIGLSIVMAIYYAFCLSAWVCKSVLFNQTGLGLCREAPRAMAGWHGLDGDAYCVAAQSVTATGFAKFPVFIGLAKPLRFNLHSLFKNECNDKQKKQ